jgi:hypothetical protein
MGKASSSKKIERAARAAASSRPGERRNLGFPLAVALVVVLGVGLVAFARSTREVSAAPRIGDHWHSGYDIYVCDDYRAEPIATIGEGLGIHSHGDGLMHIHPSSGVTTGSGATLGRWFESFGGSIDDAGITLDTGERIEEGEDCNGEPTVFTVFRFDASDLGVSPEAITTNPGSARFLKSREFFVFAFVPEGATPPQPSQGRLDSLDRVDPRDITGPVPEDAETYGGDGEDEVTTTTANEDGATTTTAAG